MWVMHILFQQISFIGTSICSSTDSELEAQLLLLFGDSADRPFCLVAFLDNSEADCLKVRLETVQ